MDEECVWPPTDQTKFDYSDTELYILYKYGKFVKGLNIAFRPSLTRKKVCPIRKKGGGISEEGL